MATDLRLELEDRPGALADVGEALGRAGVNIDGFCGTTIDGRGVIHVLVEDAAAARAALEETRARVAAEREVLVTTVEDHPGALGQVARRLADAGVNLQVAYLATATRLVLGPDDLEKARGTLSGS